MRAPCPIDDEHDITSFDCGEDVLNEWLQRHALKNERSRGSRTFVVCDGNVVVGYYALAVGSVNHIDAPRKVRRNMPDPIPVMVLGRLAVDLNWQGRGIGPSMLKDAIHRTLGAAKEAGIRALLVHALSERAKNFYEKFGFYESPTNDMTVMITLDEAEKALIS